LDTAAPNENIGGGFVSGAEEAVGAAEPIVLAVVEVGVVPVADIPVENVGREIPAVEDVDGTEIGTGAVFEEPVLKENPPVAGAGAKPGIPVPVADVDVGTEVGTGVVFDEPVNENPPGPGAGVEAEVPAFEVDGVRVGTGAENPVAAGPGAVLLSNEKLDSSFVPKTIGAAAAGDEEDWKENPLGAAELRFCF
jgi:hypothetical protein